MRLLVCLSDGEKADSPPYMFFWFYRLNFLEYERKAARVSLCINTVQGILAFIYEYMFS
jgi:hypothetical protein